MVEINFLCVHKKLRAKRVAPVLIREITRRVNLQGIFQAVYTAGVVLPKPVGTCRSVQQRDGLIFSLFTSLFIHCILFPFRRYWHRSLNPRKLIEVKFSHLSRNMTMQRTMKLYRLPEVSGNGHESVYSMMSCFIVPLTSSSPSSLSLISQFADAARCKL